MTDAEALYRQLLARPHTDPLRALELMYADAVESTDPERAELIRVQCEIERDPEVPHESHAELKAREQELLLRNADRWLRAPIGTDRGGFSLVNFSHWECGFPVLWVREFEHCWRVEREGYTRPVLVPTASTQRIALTCHTAGVRALNLEPHRRERDRTYWHWPRPAGAFPEWIRALSEREFDTRGEAELALGRASVLAAVRWLDARKFDGTRP